jgi:heme/copper-type cytochrome/quinol oxidase subunit 1
MRIVPDGASHSHPPTSLTSNDQIYNAIFAAHTFIIILLIVIPILIGKLRNCLVPLIPGVPDTAFPWINNVRFWFLPPPLTLLLASHSRRRCRNNMKSLSPLTKVSSSCGDFCTFSHLFFTFGLIVISLNAVNFTLKTTDIKPSIKPEWICEIWGAHGGE